MPGYIDAFQEGYVADWDQYIVDAQEQFRLAAEASVRERELKAVREEQLQREAEKKRQSQTLYRDALRDLRAVIAAHSLPEEGMDEFLAALSRVVNLGGGSDVRSARPGQALSRADHRRRLPGPSQAPRPGPRRGHQGRGRHSPPDPVRRADLPDQRAGRP